MTLWLYKQEDSAPHPTAQPLARTAQTKRPPPLPPRSSKGQLTKKSEEKTNVAKMHLLLVSETFQNYDAIMGQPNHDISSF